MYTYIVQRTQIYLSERETSALDREAQRTGLTRSHLIREAIAERYLTRADSDEIRRALKETAGVWKKREETGEAAVERLRSGRLKKVAGSR
jgi:predicted transcriptional regulator